MEIMTENKNYITPDLTVHKLLLSFPEIEDKMIEKVPAFNKLRNPVLRATIAKVTTLRQAAKIGNISLNELINFLRAETGEEETEMYEEVTAKAQRPDWLIQEKIKIEYDARIDLENGIHPVAVVTKQVESLSSGDIFLLITPFYPAPLVDIFVKKGCEVWSEKISEAEVNTFIKK